MAPFRVQTGHWQDAIILFLNSDPRQPFQWGQTLKADHITSRPALQTLMFRLLEVRGHLEKLFMPFTLWEFSNLQWINKRIRRRRIDNIDGDTAAEVIACHQFMYENHKGGDICMCVVNHHVGKRHSDSGSHCRASVYVFLCMCLCVFTVRVCIMVELSTDNSGQ